jgi:hypothetical protein
VGVLGSAELDAGRRSDWRDELVSDREADLRRGHPDAAALLRVPLHGEQRGQPARGRLDGLRRGSRTDDDDDDGTDDHERHYVRNVFRVLVVLVVLAFLPNVVRNVIAYSVLGLLVGWRWRRHGALRRLGRVLHGCVAGLRSLRGWIRPWLIRALVKPR